MKNSLVAKYKVITAQGKIFRIKILRVSPLSLTLFCETGFLWKKRWEYLDSTHNEVFIPDMISRHFGFTARYKIL